MKKLLNLILKNISHTKIIAIGFFLVILTGSLLLMLPIATRSGEDTTFLGALFTSTSATCVTGLIVYDTFTHWTVFGQVVIITLIQIGGLGFLTIGVMFALFLGKRITLSARELLQDSMNVLNIGGIVKFTKKIIRYTIIFESVGAILLSIRFIPEFGLLKGVYFSIFHSVSAFCNAGFDLMGGKAKYSSLCSYSNDIIVNFTIMSLIIIGGIGFIVWDDISKNRLHFRKYMLHTKLVLCTTAILVFGGALMFYIFENNNLMKGMGPQETILTSLFSSVTPRTAGFNSIDTAGLTTASKIMSMILMFIGGSPGSTAGGIKTITIAILFIKAWSLLRNSHGSNVFGRRISEADMNKADSVLLINLVLAVTAGMAICAMQPLLMEDVYLEVFSAIGTVGMSTGITRELTTVPRIILILLMYAGRIGSMSFAMSFTERKRVAPVNLPEEKVMIG